MIRVEEMAAQLRLTNTRLHRALRRESHVDLTPSQISALATINRLGPLTLGSLAEQEGVAPPSITKILAVLEDDGYVTRAPDPDDRRVSFVTATKKGVELIEESRRRKTAWLTDRLRQLTSDERRRLADALDVLEGLTK
ncbi:MAG TPA: MarR family transcriptional regulator [Acidimicrobiales bacterium]|nr:MarR family transcriptional regulator [Acidimicrobiales bacterium]